MFDIQGKAIIFPPEGTGGPTSIALPPRGMGIRAGPTRMVGPVQKGPNKHGIANQSSNLTVQACSLDRIGPPNGNEWGINSITSLILLTVIITSETFFITQSNFAKGPMQARGVPAGGTSEPIVVPESGVITNPKAYLADITMDMISMVIRKDFLVTRIILAYF